MKSNLKLTIESDELRDYIDNSIMKSMLEECELKWDQDEQKWWLRIRLNGKINNFVNEKCDALLTIYKAAEKQLGF